MRLCGAHHILSHVLDIVLADIVRRVAGSGCCTGRDVLDVFDRVRRGVSITLHLRAPHSDRGVAVVAFDDGASLAGNESKDSCVTTSGAARSWPERRECRLPTAAQPIKLAPHTPHHRLDVVRRRAEYAPYKRSPAPAMDTSRRTLPPSRYRCRQPRRSQVCASERLTVRFMNCSDSITPRESRSMSRTNDPRALGSPRAIASERSAEHEPERRRDDQRRTWVVLDHACDVRQHVLRIMAAHVVGSRAQPFRGHMRELLDLRPARKLVGAIANR